MRRAVAEIERLLAEARALRFVDHARVERACLDAVALLGRSELALPPQRAADLHARTWAQLANARRCRGRYEDAQVAIERATAWCLRAGDPGTLRAGIESARASLLSAKRDTKAALSALVLAERRSPEQKPRYALQRAIIRRRAGDPEGARGDLLTSLAGSSDPEIVVPAAITLISTLVDLGELETAERVSSSVERRPAALAQPLLALKFRWANARIGAERGLIDSPAALQRVAAEFVERQMWVAAALVQLDLAVTLGRMGDLACAAGHADAAAAELAKAGVEPDAIAARTLAIRLRRGDAGAVVLGILEALRALSSKHRGAA